MIYLNLEDGLGNQLFQYAFARTLQQMYHEPLKISLAQFDLKTQVHPKMRHILRCFRLAPDVQFVEGLQGRMIRWWILGVHWFYRLIYYPMRHDKAWCTRHANRHGLYYDFTGAWKYEPPLLTRRKNKLVTGRFQSERYFQGIMAQLREELTITAPLSAESQADIAQIRACSAAVAVHIRLGDYLKATQAGLHICNERYYCRAMEEIMKREPDACFYIFSGSAQDIDWIRKNYHFPAGANIQYRTGEASALEDFAAMTACRHFILSNSSFGWWAQYLAQDPPRKIVVAPHPWNGMGFLDEDVYQENWIKLELEDE